MPSASFLPSRLLLLATALLLPITIKAADDALTIPNVAQQILKEEGYLLFSYSAHQPAIFHLTATFNRETIKIAETQATKEVVLALKLDKDNRVVTIRTYYAGGSQTRNYSKGLREVGFNNTSYGTPLQLNQPFLTLESPDNTLAFILSRR